jgi:hypothetical protein
MTENKILRFAKAKDALKELYGEHTELGIAEVMERARPRLKLVQKLAHSVYPKKVAEEIDALVGLAYSAITEYDRLKLKEDRPLDDWNYENAERNIEELGDEPDEYDADQADEWNEWSHEKELIEKRLMRKEEKAREKIRHEIDLRLKEFKTALVDLISELDKWEVAEYPDALKKTDLIRADMDSLAQRLARGEISEKTYNDAIKRLEDQLRKIESMERK